VFATTALPAVAFGAATVALTLPSGLDARQATVVVFVLVVAWGFVGSGLWVLAREQATRFGLLSVAIGCGLFLACWVFSGVAVAYTLGLMFGLLWLPLLVHMVLAFPSGRLQRRTERWLVGWAYLVGLVLQPLPWLFWEGDYAPVCEGCPRNLALLEPDSDLAHALLGLYVAMAAAGGAVAVAYLVRIRWWQAAPRERHALTPVVVVCGALLVLLTAGGAAGAAGQSAIAQGLAFGYFTALAALPFALLAALLRSRAHRGEAVSRLVERLGEAVGPDGLRDALAHAFGDPSLEVAYWVPERDGYIDGRGRPLDAADRAAGRVWTEIRHERRLLAAISHDPAVGEDPGLVTTVGAAVALALERERLAAALRANVRELRASRARIVQAADEARRRLERDLHDGAQQRLVSLLLNLKLARRDVESGEQAPLWDGVERELADALQDLRALASGILPPALSDHGLEAAVQELAGRSAVDVSIIALPRERLPQRVEVAAYFVIAEALANVAKHANATGAIVRVTAADGRVCAEVSDNGVGGATLEHGSGLRGLADRVEALDGRLTVLSPPGAGTTLRAELPCPS
jgi:signal transduction histidine kinase